MKVNGYIGVHGSLLQIHLVQSESEPSWLFFLSSGDKDTLIGSVSAFTGTIDHWKAKLL